MSRKYRLYPEAVALTVMSMHCDHARFVWNLALEQWNAWYPGRRNHAPGFAEQSSQLTQARAVSPWLADGSTVVQQAALRDFDQAKTNFFSGSHHRPKWRSAKDARQGFLVRDAKVRPDPNPRFAQTLIPKAGWVRFRLSREVPDQLCSARVTIDAAGCWHISFTADAETTLDRGWVKQSAIGVDRGVVVPAALSDGRLLDAKFHYRPEPANTEPAAALTAAKKQGKRDLRLAREQSRRRRLEQQLARQRRTRKAQGAGPAPSNRETSTRLALNRVRAREVNRRKDWVEQTSHLLVQSAHLVVLEKLPVKQMTKSARGTAEQPGTNVAAKAGLNRGILASGWAMLATRTRTKAERSTWCRYAEVPAHHTSQTCPACAHVSPENRESQAVFRCQMCGHQQHADVVGAINVHQRGIELVAAAGSVVDVRRDLNLGSRKRKTQPWTRTTGSAA